MKILVFQHADVEHPGIFRKFFAEDGHEWVPVNLHREEKPPLIENFDALWVMGGPMDTWEENKYPWLKDEKKYIRDAVKNKGVPYLGLCLGHQLLGVSLGGNCGPAKQSEVGVLEVVLTEEGSSGILFDGFPDKFKCLQWHGAELNKIPDGGVVLASSNECYIQSLKWGTRAFSLQFHVEVEENTVEQWSKIPAYENALFDSIGVNGAKQLKHECELEMENFNNLAERLYINWLQTSAKA